MKRIFLTLLVLAGFSCTCMSQFRMSVGPLVGMNYNFYHGTNIKNSNMSYNGAGVSVGGQVDMGFTPVVGLLATVTAYDMMSANGSMTQQGSKVGEDVSLAYLMISPALKFSVPNTGLGFFIGPGIGFKLTGTSESYQIVNGQRQQISPESDLINMKPRVNGQAGMSYDFDLKSLYLTPYFLFDLGFTEGTEAGGWKASGIKFGLAIKFKVVK
jgi:hypothetical protein